MTIAIECPHCGAKLRLKDDSALGKKIRCRKCEKPFVAKAADEDDDLFSDAEMAPMAPPPGLAGVKRKKKKVKSADDDGGSPAKSGDTQLPKWVIPTAIGVASIVAIGVLFGAGMLIRGAMARTGGGGMEAPTEWSNYRNPAEKFSCVYPANWEMEGSTSIGGGGASWVRFTSGEAKINIRESIAGGALSDIAGVGADPNEEDESMTPVAKLHEFRKESFAEGYSDVQEHSVTTIQSGMGDARRSEFTASQGFSGKLRGYRVTYISPRAQMNAVCECPEEDWEKAKPIFEKVIASVAP